MHQALQLLAAEMAVNGTDRQAPVRSVMALLGDRWTTLILLILATGDWRHTELKRRLAGLSVEKSISQRVMTLKLRALERDGFVRRTASCDVPPKVSYSLTPLGEELHVQARSTIDWINANCKAIIVARDTFDRC